MQHYAHIVAGTVVETLATEANIASLFHPAMTWVAIPPGSAVAQGWRWDGGKFTPPATDAAAPAAHSATSVAAQLAALQVRLDALATLVAGK